MSKLVWDQVGERVYETGVDHGVLYPQSGGAYPKGVAWNGLITVTETPSGAEDNALYADNMKYLNLKGAEEFGATLECYYYPQEWKACNGEAVGAPGVTLSQQTRNTFGLCYRTLVGNDTEGTNHGYKLHLIYGCSATPSERSYGTINDSPDAITFSYEIATTPVPVDGFQPTALVTIDSTDPTIDKTKLAALEKILYGSDESSTGADDGADPRLPYPDEVISIFAAA